MRIKGKLSYIRLLVPVLLFTGVHVLAQAAADSRMPVAGSASHNSTKPHAERPLISDRTFLMKSIKEIAMNQRFTSQSVGTGCSSSIFSVAAAKPVSPDGCPIVDCPAPPPGCSYQNPPTDQNGCATGCGELVCGPEM